MRKYGYFAFGAIMGGLLGSIAALLFTPSSGENIRGKFSNYSDRFKDEILNAYNQRRSDLEQELNKLRQPK